MKKIAVVGVYGTGPDFTTGQAVKCHTIIDWLKNKYSNNKVIIVNTYQWKKNPIKLFFELFIAMKQCRNIIIMPAQHGVKVFAPLVYYMNRIFNRSVHYIVIGGWLASLIKSNVSLKKYISSFQGVHVETMSMKSDLEKLKLTNVYYMPNSRPYVYNTLDRKKISENQLRLCTYSRVVKTKGIEDAIMICKRANELLGLNIFKLDVYGKIDPEYEVEFKNLINNYSNIACYKGCKNADETLQTLSKYFVLLFPTYYEGEGFAGTILDAFATELPVIANDWKYNSEIIINGVNGFIYPFKDIETAAHLLTNLYKDKNLYYRIQTGCKESAIKYSTDHVMDDFSKMLC